MKEGFYLSTYLFINDLAYLTGIELRHDMNLSLWEKNGNNVKLIRYWELERVTGLKQHRRAFYNVEHAKEVINQLLSEFNLTIDDMNEVWGTPELDTSNDYHSLSDYNLYCYHSICHLFSSLLMDTDIFYSENILSLAVDGAPDNVLDLDIEDKYYYTGSYSTAGTINDVFPVASPGIHWGFIRDYFHLREGSLMALGTASSSELYNYSLKLIMPKDRDGVSEVVDNVTELIEYVDKLSEKDVGVLFSGFDPAFSIEDNKVSMVVKEIQKISQDIMCNNIDYAIKTYNINPKETYLSLSGGFTLNCPTNSYIMKKYRFKNFIATPCVNDTGMSLGVALYAFYKKVESKINFKFKNAYYGESDNNVSSFFEKYKQYIASMEDMSLNQIVKDIIADPIIWFQGNTEIGPRALGNRSIIADPRNTESKRILNEVKQRQWWRPVAPVILEEHVVEWFQDSYKTPFMLNTFYIKEDKAAEVPAILHIDDSARVQTVAKGDNKCLYEVLQAYKEKTGVPILCNTSLNDIGEPIINNLDELFNFAINKRIKIAYINGKRIEFLKQDEGINLGIKKRPINFNNYLSNEIKIALLKELNPHHADQEMLTVFIQNPKLYKKIDLKQKSSIRILKGIMQFRVNKFHIL